MLVIVAYVISWHGQRWYVILLYIKTLFHILSHRHTQDNKYSFYVELSHCLLLRYYALHRHWWRFATFAHLATSPSSISYVPRRVGDHMKSLPMSSLGIDNLGILLFCHCLLYTLHYIIYIIRITTKFPLTLLRILFGCLRAISFGGHGPRT